MNLYDSSAIAAELRAYVVGGDAEFLHRVLGKNKSVYVVFSDI